MAIYYLKTHWWGFIYWFDWDAGVTWTYGM